MPKKKIDEKEEIERLVNLVKKGDHDAFSKLYDLFIDKIYRYVYYRVKAEDCEDLVENVFLKVWENIRKYKSAKKRYFSAWIFKIAHNLVIDYYRASKDRNFDELKIDVPSYKREHNPIRVTEKDFNEDILRQAITRIKKSYQEIIIYKFINEFSNREISQIMKKSEGSIRILQHRALKALRHELVEIGIKYDGLV